MKKFLCYDTNDAASGKINVSANGVLKPNSTVPSSSGEPYKSLVTDGEGGVKWEDRLAYGRYRIRVPGPTSEEAISWYKVSDDFLTGSYDIGTRFYIIDSDEEYYEETIMVSNGEVIADVIDRPHVIVALHGNVTFLSADGWSITLPEKGTYFARYSDFFITGAVLGDSNEPEITWDGSNFVGKKIEQVYIPKQTVYLELKYSRVYNNEEYYFIDMTLDEVLECIENGINVVLVFERGLLYLHDINHGEATFGAPVFDSNQFTKFTITANTSEAPVRQQTFDLILPSATSGSSKKFKITVDDSGTISATEV